MLREALVTGFPVRLLKCLCAGYRLPRRARWKSFTSDQVRANGTVAAGCSCALALAKLLVHTVTVTLKAKYPMVRFQSLVDDFLLQAIGGRQNVLYQVPQAMSELVESLQHMQLVVN
eukprot:6868505-Pyramimonas_sp.AAC.1